MSRREMVENIGIALAAMVSFSYITVKKVFGQSNQQAAPVPAARKPVIPKEVIDEFGLKPAEHYGPWVLGEDGRAYNMDDAIRVIFQLLKPHWEKGKK